MSNFDGSGQVVINSPPGSQNGISDGVFGVEADFLINGQSYPWLKIDVDLSAYSVAGMIDVDVPTTLDDGTQTDFGALAQANPFLPLKVRVGYFDASTPAGPAPLFDLECGFLDEESDEYDSDLTTLTGRNSASVFQDVQIAEAAPSNRAGSDLAAYYYSKQQQYLKPPAPGGIGVLFPSPVDASVLAQGSAVVVSPGGNYVGKTGYTEAEFEKAHRARSMWDELQDAALLDAYIVRVRNGNFYYGPPPAENAYPVVALRWIGTPANPQQGDMLTCKVQHAARRSHAITVRVDGYDAKKKQHNSATYGPNGFGGAGSSIPTNGIQFRTVHNPGDLPSLRRQAYKIWHDLVHREFTATLELVPDAAFMQMIAQHGSDFLVALSGCKPSANILYQVRHCKMTITAGDTDEPSLKVTLTCVNHSDQVGGGEYLWPWGV